MPDPRFSLVFRLEHQPYVIPALAFSPDGSLLASLEHRDTGSAVELRDTRTGSLRLSLPLTSGNEQGVSLCDLSFNADGSQLLCACVASLMALFIWDINTGEQRLAVDTHDEMAAFCPTAPLLACSSYHVRLLDSQTGDELAVMEPVGCENMEFWDETLAFSPTGALLATSCWMGGEGDGNIRLWDLPGRVFQQVLPTGDCVRQLAFSLDGSTLLAVTTGDIQAWNLQTGHHTVTALPPAAVGYSVVTFSPDRRRLATVFCTTQADRSCWWSPGVVDIESGHAYPALAEPVEADFWAVAISASNQLAAAEEERQILVWNIL